MSHYITYCKNNSKKKKGKTLTKTTFYVLLQHKQSRVVSQTFRFKYLQRFMTTTYTQQTKTDVFCLNFLNRTKDRNTDVRVVYSSNSFHTKTKVKYPYGR